MTDYSYYSNVFSIKNVAEHRENIRINKHVIKPKEDKQLSFGSIYSLKLVKLEILKTYIKTNLAHNFFQLFKSFTGASILF